MANTVTVIGKSALFETRNLNCSVGNAGGRLTQLGVLQSNDYTSQLCCMCDAEKKDFNADQACTQTATYCLISRSTSNCIPLLIIFDIRDYPATYILPPVARYLQTLRSTIREEAPVVARPPTPTTPRSPPIDIIDEPSGTPSTVLEDEVSIKQLDVLESENPREVLRVDYGALVQRAMAHEEEEICELRRKAEEIGVVRPGNHFSIAHMMGWWPKDSVNRLPAGARGTRVFILFAADVQRATLFVYINVSLLIAVCKNSMKERCFRIYS